MEEEEGDAYDEDNSPRDVGDISWAKVRFSSLLLHSLLLTLF
jgi:hypothetical protein